MKTKAWIFAVAFLLASTTSSAMATMMTASFSGAVSGYLFAPATLQSDFPVGTAVSWQFTFDDSFRTLNANDIVFGQADRPVTGSAQVGSDSIVLNNMHLFSISYNGNTNEIFSFRWQVEGTGPTVTGGGEFFGVWLTLDPALNLEGAPMIGYAYTTQYEWGSITSYGYLETAGAFNVRQAGEVPLPATLWLMLPALAWLGRRHAAKPADRTAA